jgi:hypothetical protein
MPCNVPTPRPRSPTEWSTKFHKHKAGSPGPYWPLPPRRLYVLFCNLCSSTYMRAHRLIYSERYLHTFLSTRIGHGFWNCRRKHTYFYKELCGKYSILKNDCCLIAERDVSGLGIICTQRWLAELRVLQRWNAFLRSCDRASWQISL